MKKKLFVIRALHGLEEASTILDSDSFLIVFPGDAHKRKIQIGTPDNVSKSIFKVIMR